MIRRYVREKLFSLAQHELADYLAEHEEELVREFRVQMQKMDARIPEEKAYIDVKMVPLGEAILRASLTAVREFLRGHRHASVPQPGRRPF